MANAFRFFVVIVLLFHMHTRIQAINYCHDKEYIRINDPRRSTAYSKPINSSWICDRSLIDNDVWYRFVSEAGVKMATTRPELNSCGTAAPIWMNGSHPTVEEGTVKRKACVNARFVRPIGCGYFHDINVRNCSGYYIYQLKTPLICNSAYCIGSKLLNCSGEEYCLENLPPYFNMPDRLYAFENSKFVVPVNVTDPEGYPLTYDEPTTMINGTASYDKMQRLLHFSVMKSGSVLLNVVDKEKLKANHTIEIVTKSCPCQRRGVCFGKKKVSTDLEDLSNFICHCVEPYTGNLCEKSPCDNLPCFPRVNCSVTNHSYSCGDCPLGMKGDGENCRYIFSDDKVVITAEMAFVFGIKWNSDLLDKASFFYKQKTAEIETQIALVYRDSEHFLNVIVTRYRRESLVVEFLIVLKREIDDPLMPLRTLANKNLGNFTVDSESIRQKDSFVVKGSLKIVSGLVWRDDLLDKSSSYYKIMSDKVTYEINKIYADEKEFLYVFVTGFCKKNLIVEFKLVWRKKISNPLEKLHNETKDGKLGSLEIATDDLNDKTSTESSKKKYFGLEKAVFIFVVCLVSVLALISIVVCGVCIRKKHISIVMLTLQDDQCEICTNNSNQTPTIEMKPRASRNQVVDHEIEGKTAW